MQLSGEEFIRVSRFVGDQHSSEQTAVAAPEALVTGNTTTGNPNSNRAAWVRVATAPALPRTSNKSSVLSSDPVTTTDRADIERIVQLGQEVPDVREGVVSSLRERIEAGTYFVGAETIAEMMLRRTLADRLR